MMVSNSAAESDSSLTGTPGRRMTSKSSGSSSVRKEQNKAASRVYRERRKQRLALLEQLLEKEKIQEATPDKSQVEPEAGAGAEPVERRDTPEISGLSSSDGFSDEPVSQVVTLGGIFGHNDAANESSSSTFVSPWPITYSDSLFDMEFAGMSDGFNPMMASQSIPFSPGRAFRSGVTTTHATNELPDSALHPAFEKHNTPSSSALSPSQFSKPANPRQENEQEQKDESLKTLLANLMRLPTPDVKQVIYLQQNGLFGAIMENTLALGLLKGGAEMLFSEDGTSPFNQDWLSSGGAMQIADIRAKFAATPKDLQPLDIQITFEHHVYLDVLPFPVFREKALRALTCDPPLFDEDELCVDLTVNGGLVVWGTQGNNQGMDACRSWDMRSWEPKPWFLKKYWFLCGGWEDEMWKTARWWHAMRNERLPSRPPDMPTLFEV